MTKTPYIIFASTYNCDTYGSGAYSENGECVTTTDTTNQDGLATTGEIFYVGAGVGILLIATAIAIILRRRKKSPKK